MSPLLAHSRPSQWRQARSAREAAADIAHQILAGSRPGRSPIDAKRPGTDVALLMLRGRLQPANERMANVEALGDRGSGLALRAPDLGLCDLVRGQLKRPAELGAIRL